MNYLLFVAGMFCMCHYGKNLLNVMVIYIRSCTQSGSGLNKKNLAGQIYSQVTIR